MYGTCRDEGSPSAATKGRPIWPAWLLLCCALWAGPARAQQDPHAHRPPPAERAAPPGRAPGAAGPGVIRTPISTVRVPDIELLDQDGRRVRLYSDLIKGRVVVLSFFFTSCVNVCLSQGLALKSLKARLAGRLGRDVFLVSISKDPWRDTPASLKRWGEQFDAGGGWSLVTGDVPDISSLILGLTGVEAASSIHDPVLLIGNDRTGVWRLGSADATADEVLALIENVAQSAAPVGQQ
jgi:protein SCO1/2